MFLNQSGMNLPEALVKKQQPENGQLAENETEITTELAAG